MLIDLPQKNKKNIFHWKYTRIVTLLSIPFAVNE